MVDLTRDDIERSLNAIESEFVPRQRRATTYCLETRNNHWPSKYVVRRAYELKHLEEEVEGKFHGGPQIIGILEPLGYSVIKAAHADTPHCQEWCLADSEN